MKIRMAIGLAGGLLIALISLHAWSQASAPEAASNGAAMSASTNVPAKSDRAANRALRRQVYAAIAKHKEIDAGSISVVVGGGAVTLHGTVVDASQIDKVTDIAKRVPGVTSVTDELTVQKPFGGQ